jgi:hypothetical protein
MFSVVVVYNNEQALNRILLPSLREQTVEYEYISVDNTKGTYKSAAEALNFGGKLSTGKYILFVHQDVELGSKTWLADAEKALDTLPCLGIAGYVGMSTEGSNFEEGVRFYGCGEITGKPLEVNTLDECVLIIPKAVFTRLQFDAKMLDGWHCYGVDYCLSAQEMGLKAYVVPAFIYHRSWASNVRDLFKYQRRVYRKHKKYFPTIYTTCGRITRMRVMVSLIADPLLRIYEKLSWVRIVEKELKDCESVLDLGGGCNSPLQICKVPYLVGVDLFDPYLEESSKKALHTKYIKADVRTVEFPSKSFDAVFASGVLEHLTKDEGHELLKKMSLWAKKKVIITTLNGYLYQGDFDSNPYQIHKSGWTVSGLRNAGFKVHGMNSWELLRGPRGIMKLKPAFLWKAISVITQQIAHYCPRLAFQLLAIKRICN